MNQFCGIFLNFMKIFQNRFWLTPLSVWKEITINIKNIVGPLHQAHRLAPTSNCAIDLLLSTDPRPFFLLLKHNSFLNCIANSCTMQRLNSLRVTSTLGYSPLQATLALHVPTIKRGGWTFYARPRLNNEDEATKGLQSRFNYTQWVFISL